MRIEQGISDNGGQRDRTAPHPGIVLYNLFEQGQAHDPFGSLHVSIRAEHTDGITHIGALDLEDEREFMRYQSQSLNLFGCKFLHQQPADQSRSVNRRPHEFEQKDFDFLYDFRHSAFTAVDQITRPWEK
jgi:hypothetical protein